MLKNIPPVLSPELLKTLCEMGHGDELVISDGNFPSHTVGKNAIVVRADGHGVPELLDDGRFEAANGFVTVTVDGDGTVTAMEENAAARAAWLAGRGGEEPPISPAETALELLADHEYRLCLLELGAAE